MITMRSKWTREEFLARWRAGRERMAAITQLRAMLDSTEDATQRELIAARLRELGATP